MTPTHTGGNMKIHRFAMIFAALIVFAMPAAIRAQSGGNIADSGFAANSLPASTVNCFAAAFVSGGGADASGQAGDGFSVANLDQSVSPCDDFYKFADGGWMKANPIPPAYASWGSFNILHDRNEDVLHTILDEAAKDKTAKPGSNWQKIGDFYASCMDESQIESAGATPLKPELERIIAISDAAGLREEIARMQLEGISVVFRFGPEQDFKDSTKEIGGARQGGLGLPERDYYFKDDEKSKTIRDGYVQHIANMFKLMGDSDETSAGEAKTVMDIETTLAKSSMKRVDMRNPDNVYHITTLAQLGEMTPHFSWQDYFKEVASPAVPDINVGQPEFFKAVDTEIASVSLADWKVYLRWHLLHSAAPALSDKFVQENFNFFSRTLTGTKEMLPRWRRCVESTDRQLGEALGQYYVQRAFPPEAKAKAQAMVQNLISALRTDISTLDWMSPDTRKKAIEKLDAITPKIGYPDKWRDYSKFEVTRGPFIENIRRGDEFEFRRAINKIGKPVDRKEFGMTPPTVNAYYSPSMNEIVFPAGILQPPFYDANRDDAMNYGGIGVVIGHEMTHGFDDQGARFDAQGNLKNWWTPDDLKNFTARGDCVANQFSGFVVEPGLNENGKLVEGESIADLGGLAISLAAFHHSLEGKAAPADIDGFTADQRFFLSYATIWAGNMRDEMARMRVNTDPHPLNQFRTNGPLSNMQAFKDAWKCSADAKMARPETERCRIW
jgi:putative endopeptidase